MSAQTAADLRATAEVLLRDGWTQYEYVDLTTGCHCLSGAYYEAVGSYEWGERRGRFQVAIKRQTGDYPVRFNDTPGRTIEEVLAALEAAAVTEESSP